MRRLIELLKLRRHAHVPVARKRDSASPKSPNDELNAFETDRSQDLWPSVNWHAADPIFGSGLPWLELHCPWPIPYGAMLAEARAVRLLMVIHRDGDFGGRQHHRGWKSICFHGLSARQTEHCTMYGLTDAEAAGQYGWTEVAALCPATTAFFRDTFSYTGYDRVRFMLLEPGGYILPHNDSDARKLGPVNMALNNPPGCALVMRGFGAVPFRPASAFQLDVSNTHAVWNRSGEDRYHIIVHGHRHASTWDPIVHRSLERMRVSHSAPEPP